MDKSKNLKNKKSFSVMLFIFIYFFFPISAYERVQFYKFDCSSFSEYMCDDKKKCRQITALFQTCCHLLPFLILNTMFNVIYESLMPFLKYNVCSKYLFQL